MYAIVKTGGKQYRVERGQRLLVERLAVAEGESVALQPILYRSEEAVFDKTGLEQVKVTAKVIAHERGEKLRVFKFKPKRGYKRRTGHRQELTRIEVTELASGATTKATPKPKAAPKAKTPAKPAKDMDTAAAQAKTKPAKPAASAKPKAAKPKDAKPAKPKAAKPKAAPKEDKPDGA